MIFWGWESQGVGHPDNDKNAYQVVSDGTVNKLQECMGKTVHTIIHLEGYAQHCIILFSSFKMYTLREMV